MSLWGGRFWRLFWSLRPLLGHVVAILSPLGSRGPKREAQEQLKGGQELPKSRPRVAKIGPGKPNREPKVPQESQREAQERPREPQRVPRQSQERPRETKRAPKRDQESSRQPKRVPKRDQAHPQYSHEGTRELQWLQDDVGSASKRRRLKALLDTLKVWYGEAQTVTLFNVCTYAALALPDHKEFIYELTCKLHQRSSFLAARVLKH